MDLFYKSVDLFYEIRQNYGFLNKMVDLFNKIVDLLFREGVLQHLENPLGYGPANSSHSELLAVPPYQLQYM